MDIDDLIGKLSDSRMHNFNEKWDLILLIRRKLQSSPPTSLYECTTIVDFIKDFDEWVRAYNAECDSTLLYALNIAKTCCTLEEFLQASKYIVDFLYQVGENDQ